ncbi:endonuclease/exonuclease/phosphatase family protein [Sphingopyxis indica]|uniref:Metal-dependent hydrolase, endonuclease/exonuclease/phosphatase family n=1 Tax=Sphingopyxis indica TaxID=436663 RepID=A0A239DAS8_9SPHN|nr:endonuclease/exonuclease/phosphatase family protein [Sphingopyxis indica]SNS28981.1 Metal-dependent hydrolase, endonuclease/exonuclease/phosphatase family [Sphingopyxis indica]
MKRWLITLFAALLALPAAAKDKADRVSAMTYNIRLDLASDGADAWPHRRKALTGLVAYYAPDFVGMQEVLLHQKRQVEADLPAYTFVGVGRDDGKEAGEFSMLGYRPDRFSLLGSGTFWLSPTPDTPSKGWDAALPRIATWARLKDRSAAQNFLVVNTHFDHIGEVARVESAKLIRRWIGAHRQAGDAVVLMGDFNSETGSAPYKAILAPGAGLIALHDTQDISRTPHFGPDGTFTGFKIEQLAGSPIDHIFVNDGVAVLRHATITQQTGGRLPSDHYPVLADLCVGKGC